MNLRAPQRYIDQRIGLHTTPKADRIKLRKLSFMLLGAEIDRNGRSEISIRSNLNQVNLFAR